ncbi:MAG: hypothetical protein AABY26_01550 [Nanoarchaeota archaeon]
MTDNYTIREIRIEILPGIILVSNIQSVSALKKLLEDLEKEGFDIGKVKENTPPTQDERIVTSEKNISNPMNKIEIKANLATGALEHNKIVAFKDNVPQLLKPNSFTNPSEAVIFLLFTVETGLSQSKVNYDFFKELHNEQNIKSGSPLAMMLTNLRNNGYLDKKEYLTNRSLRLTAKGEKKAIEILKGQLQEGS